ASGKERSRAGEAGAGRAGTRGPEGGAGGPRKRRTAGAIGAMARATPRSRGGGTRAGAWFFLAMIGRATVEAAPRSASAPACAAANARNGRDAARPHATARRIARAG